MKGTIKHSPLVFNMPNDNPEKAECGRYDTFMLCLLTLIVPIAIVVAIHIAGRIN